MPSFRHPFDDRISDRQTGSLAQNFIPAESRLFSGYPIQHCPDRLDNRFDGKDDGRPRNSRESGLWHSYNYRWYLVGRYHSAREYLFLEQSKGKQKQQLFSFYGRLAIRHGTGPLCLCLYGACPDSGFQFGKGKSLPGIGDNIIIRIGTLFSDRRCRDIVYLGTTAIKLE